MHFRHLLPALFATSGLASKFENLTDLTCQNYAEEYHLVTAKQLEDIIVQGYPTGRVEKPLSLSYPSATPTKDDTYRFVYVPQWSDEGSKWPRVYGGGLAVVYYEDTDTYVVLGHLASIQSHGYAGFCK